MFVRKKEQRGRGGGGRKQQQKKDVLLLVDCTALMVTSASSVSGFVFRAFLERDGIALLFLLLLLILFGKEELVALEDGLMRLKE